MFYFTVLLLLQAATFIHGDYQGRTTLVKNAYDNFGVIQMGQNKQRLTTLFDTGSTHVWVISDEKPVTQVQQLTVEPNLPFKKSASSTFEKTGKTFCEKYTIGEISGYRAIDNIIIKSIPMGINLGKVEFGVVETMTASFATNILYLNGVIFGLNLVSRELIEGEETSSLELLAQKAPVFGFYYKTQEKYLVYGEPDEELISGPFSTHDVVKIEGKYFGWNVKITKLQVQKLNQKNEFTPDAGTYGRVLTGNSYVLVGPKQLFEGIIEYIYHLVPIANYDANQSYAFKCPNNIYVDVLSKLPVLSVYIDDVKMDIEPEYYLKRVSGSDLCYCGLAAADINYIKIGNGFIAKYYTKFDYNKKQVSFALANGPPISE